MCGWDLFFHCDEVIVGGGSIGKLDYNALISNLVIIISDWSDQSEDIQSGGTRTGLFLEISNKACGREISRPQQKFIIENVDVFSS